MKFYRVGGSVRDQLLGLPVKDHDYVVVGGTPEEMVRLGFRPVGKDFPVFLHPQTHEEYALARTERKTARGYRGFEIYAAPDVTLEEDLARRDLTVNAIALDENGDVIDPFGGVADLRAGILRHVSPAFTEDPVRILRVARFAARFGFRVAPETLELMGEMVASGEVNALVPERIWQELARGLMTDNPSRMFLLLRDRGALARVLPEIDGMFTAPPPPECPLPDAGAHAMRVIDHAAAISADLPVRFAALVLHPGEDYASAQPANRERSAASIRKLCTRIRVPNNCRDLALISALHHREVHRALELGPNAILRLLEGTDAFRRPARFELLLVACEADFRGCISTSDLSYRQADRLRVALAAADRVDAGALASEGGGAESIRERLHRHRLAAVERALDTPAI